MKLCELIQNCKCVSIVGMCKNAGKTTVLNRLIAESEGTTTLGVTSIGRDGETKDVVTDTKKPLIFVRRGTIFATASGLLQFCTVTKEILFDTGVNTPLGQVIVSRALSNGYVQLAGASIVSQLVSLRNTLFDLGCDKVLLDGAINRMSLASTSLCDGVILATGASLGRDIDAVVASTVYAVKLLSLESSTEGVFVDGALTDEKVKNYDGGTIVVEDASKILLSERVFDAIKGRIAVKNKTNLLAVTLNPFSAYGGNFDREEFAKRLRQKISLPIINAEEDF